MSGAWRSGFVALAILLACAAAPADEPTAAPAAPADGPGDSTGQTVVAIEFVCDAPIDEAGLLRLLPTKVGDALGAGDLAESQRRLSLTALFTDVGVEAVERDGGVAVVLRLKRQVVVNAVRFQGNDTISTGKLRSVARVMEGSPFPEQTRQFSETRVRELYAQEGFDRAEVGARAVQREPGEIDVVFRIREGTPRRIGSVVFAGNPPLDAAEMRAVLRVRPGDRYRRERVLASETRLLRLLRANRFYEAVVDSHWEPGAEAEGGLRFDVEPGPPFVLSFSGNHHFGDSAILKLIDLKHRPIVTDGTWRELARRAQRAYQEDGFYFAKVAVEIEPGEPKQVRLTTDEGRQFHLAPVLFEGNHGLSRETLRAALATRPPSWVPWSKGVLLDDVLEDDLKRLWFLYRRHGYASAEIRDLRTDFDDERGTVTATVVIEEGPRSFVRRVERSGLDAVAVELPEPGIRPGAVLDPDAIEAETQHLITALAAAGYADAGVSAQVESTPAGETVEADVRFRVEPGRRYTIGAIVPQNNIDTRARVLMRELRFATGEPLNSDALLESQTDIYRLGIFRTVTIRPLPSAEGESQRDVVINVTEKLPATFQWGAGYNTRDGVRGFLELSHSNLQGMARRLALRTDLSLDVIDLQPNEYVVNLGFREPHAGDSRWDARANFIAQRATRSVDQFSLERLAFLPAIERPLLRRLQVGAEMQLEAARVFDVAADVRAFNPRDEGRLDTLSFGPFLVFDGRDDSFLPRRGVFDAVRVRFAPGTLGSDVPFVKVTAQHSQHVPLGREVTFVYAARGGWTTTLGEDAVVPIRERFFLGGRSTVRGFDESEIGPVGAPIVDEYGRVVDSGGNPLGGDLVVNLNAQLNFPLLFGLGGSVFSDAGGVYLQERPIIWNDFRRTAGLGLRYITPVGPISLDYGFKIDRRSGESIGQLHFSIGSVF